MAGPLAPAARYAASRTHRTPLAPLSAAAVPRDSRDPSLSDARAGVGTGPLAAPTSGRPWGRATAAGPGS
ncbi:hypothetical protein [Clavibacter michiganensis]|uniref:hypothetical protein n=1 Tax=Clavibacter michiganensis TaxID=28447 RepID=UPI0029318C6D|nr:hypothetical protein [Clavibacter michiganensis]